MSTVPSTPSETRTVTLADFLEPHEITACLILWKHTRHCPECSKHPEAFTEVVCTQLIAPRIERINKRLGQENDPKYLAYVVEAAMQVAGSDTVARTQAN